MIETHLKHRKGKKNGMCRFYLSNEEKYDANGMVDSPIKMLSALVKFTSFPNFFSVQVDATWYSPLLFLRLFREDFMRPI